MKPDVEEAIRLLTNIRWKSIDKDNMEFEARASCYQVDAIRTLLDAYASREAEVKEAVRLMKPFVSYAYPDLDGWHDADELTIRSEDGMTLSSATVGVFRAISTFHLRQCGLQRQQRSDLRPHDVPR